MSTRTKRSAWLLMPLLLALLVVAVLLRGPDRSLAASQTATKPAAKAAMKTKMPTPQEMMAHRITPAMRKAAAKRAAAARANNVVGTALKGLGALAGITATFSPQGKPDYFGTTPNFANSPLPEVVAGVVTPGTGIRKFVDSLPGMGAANANDLGQYLPIAAANTTMYPGADYYVVALVQTRQKLHADLPPTLLRGYVQLNASTLATIGVPTYLGPTIIATKDKPVRVRFINKLPTGAGGDLFLPTDKTVMGAGNGPDGTPYSQNRGNLHLHGGATPWISDGTPHQWTTPAGENTHYPKGVSVQDVPDMGKSPAGELTFYYTNQQSARLMWYHDHAYGITRLNVYAGEAGAYELNDPIEQKLVNGGTIGTTTVAPSTVPTDEIPLVIQDKTFVPQDAQLLAQDPTWDKGAWGGFGNLWYPHVYMPNQNPSDLSGANAMGRWDYGPWFWPPSVPTNGPTASGDPGTPNPSLTPEAFMDTMLVNGTPYPYKQIGRKAYRFRILNASNDRMLNLQLYIAKSNGQMWGSAPATMTLLDGNAGEIATVPAVPHAVSSTWPATWPTDGRDGGVPDPTTAGPKMIQIGTEGGLLPAPAVLDNTPVGYIYNRRDIQVLNVSNKTLFLGPAERADVVVDFSQVPDGSKVILYNDAPAPVPAFDPRYDYYTGDPDQTDTGGAPSTQAGYGPNTRTVMQFQVSGAAAPAFDTTALATALPAAYKASQDKPIVPEKSYGAATDTYARIQSNSITFTPEGTSTPINMPFQAKAIQELFEMDYGRMNATLGVELPFTNILNQTTLPFGFIDPTTEILKAVPSADATKVVTLNDGTQIWKITHNGVDTHAVHFHLFNVQLINRVGWDGAITPPDANELGWKDTLRMNPLADVIVAIRPVIPSLPWPIPDSVRPEDPTKPLGSTGQFAAFDALGQPTTTVNSMVNYGWEYVWHCHLLGHEENDMMRPMQILVAPAASTNLKATTPALSTSAPKVNLTWTKNWTSPAATKVTLLRATNSAFTANVTTFTLSASATSYTDTSVTTHVTYYYRVRPENAQGLPPWSNTANVTTPGWLPMPVTNMVVQGSGTNYVRVGWKLPTSGGPITSLKFQNSPTSATGPWSSGVTLPSNTTVYTNSGLISAKKYWFRVLSINADGQAISSVVVGSTN